MRAVLAVAALPLVACASAPAPTPAEREPKILRTIGRNEPLPTTALEDVVAAAWIGSDLVALVRGAEGIEGADTIVRLREDGRVLWSAPLPGGPTHVCAVSAGPGGDVLVGGHATVACLDPQGRSRWVDDAPLERGVAWQQVVAIDSDTVVVGLDWEAVLLGHRWVFSATVRRLDGAGRSRWTQLAGGRFWSSAPTVTPRGRALVVDGWEAFELGVDGVHGGADVVIEGARTPVALQEVAGDDDGLFVVCGERECSDEGIDQGLRLDARALELTGDDAHFGPPAPLGRCSAWPAPVATRWNGLLVLVARLGGAWEAIAIGRDGIRWRAAVATPVEGRRRPGFMPIAVRVDGPGAVVVAWGATR